MQQLKCGDKIEHAVGHFVRYTLTFLAVSKSMWQPFRECMMWLRRYFRPNLRTNATNGRNTSTHLTAPSFRFFLRCRGMVCCWLLVVFVDKMMLAKRINFATIAIDNSFINN